MYLLSNMVILVSMFNFLAVYPFLRLVFMHHLQQSPPILCLLFCPRQDSFVIMRYGKCMDIWCDEIWTFNNRFSSIPLKSGFFHHFWHQVYQIFDQFAILQVEQSLGMFPLGVWIACCLKDDASQSSECNALVALILCLQWLFSISINCWDHIECRILCCMFDQKLGYQNIKEWLHQPLTFDLVDAWPKIWISCNWCPSG